MVKKTQLVQGQDDMDFKLRQEADDFVGGMRDELATALKQLRNDGVSKQILKQISAEAKKQFIEARIEFIKAGHESMNKEMKANPKYFDESSSFPIAQDNSTHNTEKSGYLSEESSFPIAQTPSGLPKQDSTPIKSKLPKTKRKSVGDKIATWGKAALRMNPIIGQYMDNLDQEEAIVKQKERDEKINQKMLEKGIDPAKLPGGLNNTAIKLLTKIEENTRSLGTVGKNAGGIAPVNQQRSNVLSGMMDRAKAMPRNLLNMTDTGQFMLKSYDTFKSTAAGAFALGGKAKDTLGVIGAGAQNKWNEVGGLKGIKDKLSNNPLARVSGKWLGNAGNMLKSNFEPRFAGMKESFINAKSTAGDGINTVKERIASLNPFKKTAEERTEDASKKGPEKLTGILNKIADNTDDKKKKKTNPLFEGLKLALQPLFSGLMTMLGPLLSGLMAAIAPLAGFLLTATAVIGGVSWLINKTFGNPGDIKTSEDARKSTAEGSKLDKIQKMVGGQGLKPDADKTDVEKIQTERPTAANKKKWETRIFDQGTMVTAEEARALKEKHGINVPDTSIKSKAIVPTVGVESPTTAAATNETSITKPKELTSAGVTSAKIAAAEPRMTEIPSVIQTNANVKDELQEKISQQNQVKAIAPIINKTTTSINNNSTTTSIRIHPRNQESTWIRYMENRYAT